MTSRVGRDRDETLTPEPNPDLHLRFYRPSRPKPGAYVSKPPQNADAVDRTERSSNVVGGDEQGEYVCVREKERKKDWRGAQENEAYRGLVSPA